MHLRLLMALSYLRDHDGAPQQELADVLCIDANNVVLALNELEDLGHIRRRRDPADRRRHLVDLTAQGRQRTDSRRARPGRDRGRRAARARSGRAGRALAPADPGP